MWLTHLTQLTKDFINQQHIIGFDLRNEIRKTPSHVPTWGDSNVLTDWHRASTIAGNLILSSNPNLLIIIEGLNFATDLVPLGKVKV